MILVSPGWLDPVSPVFIIMFENIKYSCFDKYNMYMISGSSCYDGFSNYELTG
jgi:hypothetical protein